VNLLDEDTEAFLKQWAVSRAGNNPQFAKALRGLVDAYCALHDVGEIATIREFPTALILAADSGVRQTCLLDAKLRATKRLSGKQVYERLRSLERETGLKFAVLDRRRKLLLKEDEDSPGLDED
jgi:hypothetical protein